LLFGDCVDGIPVSVNAVAYALGTEGAKISEVLIDTHDEARAGAVLRLLMGHAGPEGRVQIVPLAIALAEYHEFFKTLEG
jgi:hypothetical protein